MREVITDAVFSLIAIGRARTVLLEGKDAGHLALAIQQVIKARRPK